jgi:hypothetical protein
MRVSKRQILELIYEQQVQNSKRPDEVQPEEDVWGTGEELEHPVDWEKESGLPDNVDEPEVLEIVERVKRRARLRRMIREQMAVVEEDPLPTDAPEDVIVGDEATPGDGEEERASASQQSLRDWLKNTASGISGMGIPDAQVPALIASMDDLILSAQSGKMSSREDKVRSHIDTE